MDDPPAILPGPGGTWIAIHPLAGYQTLNESIVAMFLSASMIVGLIVSYRSTRVTGDIKKANYMLILGIALIIMGLAGSHYLLILKRTVG